eukprot:COSAG06_NODE_6665_length_2835_cov_2.151681_5_plen_62_part_00
MPNLRSPWLAGAGALPGKLLGRLCLHTTTIQIKSKTRQDNTRQDKKREPRFAKTGSGQAET